MFAWKIKLIRLIMSAGSLNYIKIDIDNRMIQIDSQNQMIFKGTVALIKYLLWNCTIGYTFIIIYFLSSHSPERHLVSHEDIIERIHAGEQVGDAQHDQHVPLPEAEGPELPQGGLERVSGVVRGLGGAAARRPGAAPSGALHHGAAHTGSLPLAAAAPHDKIQVRRVASTARASLSSPPSW